MPARETPQERASRAALVLETSALAGDRFQDCFQDVARILGGGMFHLVKVEPGAAPEFMVADEHADALKAYVTGGWIDADTWTHASRKAARHGLLMTDKTLIDAARRTRDPFFQEYCRQWGMGSFGAWTFDLANQNWGYSLIRSQDDPYTEDELQALALLRPAADRAALLACAFRNRQARGFAEGLEASGRPSLVIDHDGRVAFITPSAERFVNRDFAIRNGRLCGADARATAGFDQLTRWARRRDTPMPAAIQIARTDARPLLAFPTPIHDDGLVALPGARAVIMFLDPGMRPLPSVAMVEAAFGLTDREAEIAVIFAEGLDFHQIADRLGVTYATVRHQMKFVFAKTGVHRQADLAALLARLTTAPG